MTLSRMDSRIDGRQNPDYSSEYYKKNKEKISIRNKEHYKRVRSTPELLQEHRKRSTEATRRWRERHPEKVIVSRKNVYLGRKRRAMGMLGGAICSRCGCDEIDYLEFNHVNGGGCKEYRDHFQKTGNYTGMVDKLLAQKRNAEGLNVLCRVCNALDYLRRKNPSMIECYQVKWESKLA